MNEHNFIVKNGNELPEDSRLFFHDEPIEFLEPSIDMFDILIKLEVFSSKSQARKNWNRTNQEIPEGFSDFERVGKLKHRITILNPKRNKEE